LSLSATCLFFQPMVSVSSQHFVVCLPLKCYMILYVCLLIVFLAKQIQWQSCI
jgi:hypothetical protein